MPNGFESDGTTPKFDKVVIRADISGIRTASNTQEFLFYGINNSLNFWSNLYSGNTAPSEQLQYMIWYDTTTNLIKYTTDYGSTWNISSFSLPLCRYTQESSQTTSIDQVFNGFGYIGSTVFALPGVKGLIPNGWNEDGMLKNIEWVCDSVITRTFPNTETFVNSSCGFNGLGFSRLATNAYSYSKNENLNKNGSEYWDYTEIHSNFAYTNGVINSFTPKTTFRAVDRNDIVWLSGLSMPSNKYIDLTLGASGAEYTARANGYVLFERGSTSGNKYINLYNNNSQLGVIVTTMAGVANARVFLPVKKGDIFRATYSADSTNPIFKLVYADGEI